MARKVTPNAGMFQKGASGNPSGRPKTPDLKEIRELAQKYCVEAIHALGSILQNTTHPTAKIAAANALLDRGYGRPESTANININREEIRDLSTTELLHLLASARAAQPETGAGTSSEIH